MFSKTIVAVSLILTVLGGSVFAGGSGEPEPEDRTITFAFGLDPGGAIGLLAQTYSEQTPGVTVEVLNLPATPTGQYDRYVTTFAAEDDTIDVLMMDIIWVSQFASAGWISPIGEQVDPRVVDGLLDGPLNANRYRGELYGLPLFTDTGMLYYRSDLLERYGFDPPQTWEELVEQAQVILAGEEDPDLSGIVFQAAQIEGITINFLEFFRGAGGRFLDDQGNYVFETQYAAEARQALQFMYDLLYTYEVAPVTVTTANPNDNRIAFQEGRAVFMRNWPFAYGSAQDPEQSEVAGAVGIAPIPSFAGNDDAVTANLGGWQLAVSSFSDAPEEALDFIEWAVGQEAQRILAEVGSQLPTYAALYNDPDFRSLNPLYEDILGVLEATFPRPVTEFYTEISGQMQPELNGALTGVKSVDEAVQQMFTGIAEVLGN